MATKTFAPNTRINPLDDPIATNQAIDEVLSNSHSDIPTIALIPPDMYQLPGGLSKNGILIRQVRVRELTGEHEEALARASQATANIFHFINTLLECGTVQIGDEPESDTKKLLKDLVVGDRDAVILFIRQATYGDDIVVPDWECPSCGNKTNLTIPISDITTKEINDPEGYNFTVSLKNKRKAFVRLANGHDQMSLYDNQKLNQAERDTILLSRCVITLTDADGTEHSLAGMPSLARKMALPDRRKILKEMAERQPGPRYFDISFKHEDCGEEAMINLGIGDLFLDLF